MVVRHATAPKGMRRLVAACLALLLTCGPGAGARAQGQAEEYELKAAFLYNFAKFVEWPAGATTHPLCLGVLGPDPFGAVLDRMLAGKTVHDRPITIRRFTRPDDVGACQLVFVTTAAARTFPLESWMRPGIVSVGDDETFVDRGGLIAFTMQSNKLRFVVNAAAADRAQVKLSSQLLKLAARVRKDGD
jgi:hypothetical protein